MLSTQDSKEQKQMQTKTTLGRQHKGQFICYVRKEERAAPDYKRFSARMSMAREEPRNKCLMMASTFAHSLCIHSCCINIISYTSDCILLLYLNRTVNKCKFANDM